MRRELILIRLWAGKLLTLIMLIAPMVMTGVFLFSSVAEAEEKVKTGSDPTDFITRYEPSYEHRELDNGSDLDIFVLRADLALKRDLSLRIDVPFVDFDPGPSSKPGRFKSERGLGDMVIQFLYKPYSDDKKAVIFGLRFDVDTATESRPSMRAAAARRPTGS